MANTENKVKEYILGDIFCDTPNMDNDWDIFMNNKKNEYPDGFQVCEAYELESARDIRNLMQMRLEDLIRLSENIIPKNIYILEERDTWYSDNDVVQLGVFDSLDKAVEAATKEYGKLEKDRSDCHYKPIKNPNNVKLFIKEATLNVFEEL
ncbi:hypothetical protein [Aliarcobacter lanthieri]|uniref:hypothetical protein n=1 Tax=Aliarcobacter lanthieri TaxID=1355374 RepID=UPI00047E2EEC|nr:hypothetical protein [Aliarcobacter lanthieri]QKF59221.1 hypothetical protein ALANTH_1112 [Aliarcobacter lanthieri]